MTKRIIYGVDLGIANTGIACSKCKQTKHIATNPSHTLGWRLEWIIDDLNMFVKEHMHDTDLRDAVMVTEELFSGRRKNMGKTIALFGCLNYWFYDIVNLTTVKPLDWMKGLGIKNKRLKGDHTSIEYARKKKYKLESKGPKDDHTADAACMIEYIKSKK